MIVSLLCLLLCSGILQSTFGVRDLPATNSTSGTGVLRQFQTIAKASVRLTEYNLPDSVLYTLPQLSGGRPVNKSRPLHTPYAPAAPTAKSEGMACSIDAEAVLQHAGTLQATDCCSYQRLSHSHRTAGVRKS